MLERLESSGQIDKTSSQSKALKLTTDNHHPPAKHSFLYDTVR